MNIMQALCIFPLSQCFYSRWVTRSCFAVLMVGWLMVALVDRQPGSTSMYVSTLSTVIMIYRTWGHVSSSVIIIVNQLYCQELTSHHGILKPGSQFDIGSSLCCISCVGLHTNRTEISSIRVCMCRIVNQWYWIFCTVVMHSLCEYVRTVIGPSSVFQSHAVMNLLACVSRPSSVLQSQ